MSGEVFIRMFQSVKPIYSPIRIKSTSFLDAISSLYLIIADVAQIGL